MNLSTLTIGRRVSLGFLWILLFGLGLGGLVVWKMYVATQGARFLSDAVAPQAAVAARSSRPWRWPNARFAPTGSPATSTNWREVANTLRRSRPRSNRRTR